MFTKNAFALLVMASFLFISHSTARDLVAQSGGSIEITRQTERKGVKTDTSKFANPDGWAWLWRPVDLHLGRDWSVVGSRGFFNGCSHIDSEDGSLRVYFIQGGPTDPVGRPEFRLVILDADGHRYIPTQIGQVAGAKSYSRVRGTHLVHGRYSLAPLILDPRKATHIGIEQIDPKQK